MTVFALEADLEVQPPRRAGGSDLALLSYLEALTFDFEHEGKPIHCVLVYAEPDPENMDRLRPVVADDTGYEGIACVDDTARAALLALEVYERSHSRKALMLARQWLGFVEYMQYPDGSFANFIRNTAGTRNVSGPTSHKGGYWWSARALRALARAYRLTGDASYLDRYQACHLAPLPDGKINALLALAELDLHAAQPTLELRRSIIGHCETIVESAGDAYFRDHPETEYVNLWGYHQLHAVAAAADALAEPRLLTACRQTVRTLIEPDVRDRFWYSYPDRRKDGIPAYAVTPILQGLSAMYRATGAKRYRRLALNAAAWFYGRNDARTTMYDPTTGRCRDGISHATASLNNGAESSIEAGFAELERRWLLEQS